MNNPNQQHYFQGGSNNKNIPQYQQPSKFVFHSDYENSQLLQNNDPDEQYQPQYEYENQQEEARGAEILTITVDIGNGQFDNLLICEGDEPEIIASNFCQKHGIKSQLQSLLAEQIKQHIENVLIESEKDNTDQYEIPLSQSPEQQPRNMRYFEQQQPNFYPQEYDRNIEGECIPQFIGQEEEYEEISYQQSSPNRPVINENSKRIIENKRRSGGGYSNVYTRLHSHAVAKQRVQQRESQSQQKVVKQKQWVRGTDENQSMNFGVRLYSKGVKKQEEWNRICKEIQFERQQKEDNAFSFQPTINPSSKTYGRECKDEKLENQLLKYGVERKERIDKKRSDQLYDEQYSFHPEINRYSEKIMNERSQMSMAYDGHPGFESMMSTNDQKFHDLFEDAKRRQERKVKIYSACLDNECTFTPELGITKYLGREQNQNALERLKIARAKSKESNQKTNEEFDPVTGQPYFKPRVGRAPTKERNVKTIGDHLYANSQVYRTNKEKALENSIFKQQSQANTRFVDYQTNKIVDNKKRLTFQNIFRFLDSDQDGVISAQKIQIQQMSPDILQIFTPLFCEMEEMAQALDEQEFIEASLRLYETLTIPNKNILLSFKGKWDANRSEINQPPSFQPKLNENSMRIAQKTRPFGQDVAEILLRKKQVRWLMQELDQKILQIQALKQDEELIGCTFQPQTLTSPVRAPFYASLSQQITEVDEDYEDNHMRPGGEQLHNYLQARGRF